jgi:hypothetical protein
MTGDFLPFGGNAVMASRRSTGDDTRDYFPTPPWAARAGGEVIKQLDPAASWAWEPACGGGHMAHGLADYFDRVHCTDLHDYGGDLQNGAPLDFLSTEADSYDQADWIVSNPPFALGEEFIRTAWRRAQRGVAMLLRLQFIEGGKRHQLFTRDCPLTLLAPFSERVPMFEGRWDPDASSTTAYAWFVFVKPEAALGAPLSDAAMVSRAFGCHLVQLIGPGTKARLQRRDDILHFGPASIDWYLQASRDAALDLDQAADKAAAKKLQARVADYAAAAKRLQLQLVAARSGRLFDEVAP